MQLFNGEHPQIAIDEWEHGLVVLRYDDAIFVKNDEIQSIENGLPDNEIKVKSDREVIYL